MLLCPREGTEMLVVQMLRGVVINYSGDEISNCVKYGIFYEQIDYIETH